MTDLGARLRDQFLALARAPYDPHGLRGDALEEARRRLSVEIDGFDVPPLTRVQGLSFSPYPTARFRQLRFVAVEHIDERSRGSFIRPSPALPELAAVFVDPEELGYHNFENIVGLDRMFAGPATARLRVTKVHRYRSGVMTARLEVAPALAERLAQLDGLGLYVPPRDVSRGGRRFIFHCAALADALTTALRAGLSDTALHGFAHVNPVFRCNRFEPGDAPFAAHLDAPYHHRARGHVSKYTLLLYLTAGRGDAPLAFAAGLTLQRIEALTAVVFPQSLAHEGRPYDDGPKVFLRTELIFEDPSITYDSAVGALFSRACYLDGESVFAPELATHAVRAYHRAAAAHWRGPTGEVDGPYVHKRFRGAHFVTDGYDYWFHRGSLDPVECAGLALLDLLNAHVGGEPFRKLCVAATHDGRGDGRAWIADLLRAQARPPEPVFARLNKPALFPEPEEAQSGMGFPSSPEFADTFPSDWDATRHPRVLEVYTRARQWAMQRIVPAPILLLGKELFIDPDRFVVAGDKIHVLSSESPEPLHFAGAVFFSPEDFVDVDMKFGALHPVVPPMSFRVEGDIVHLCCDLFRNGWMVSHRSEVVPVPRILVGTDVEPDRALWLSSASLDLAGLRATTDPREIPSASARRGKGGKPPRRGG